MNEKLPRWTPEDLAIAIAKLHREKVMRVVALNVKWLDTLVEEQPETIPEIKLAKGDE